MKALSVVLLSFGFGLVPVFASTPPAVNEAEEVRAVFEVFKGAVQSGDTAAAVATMAPALGGYFEKVKALALKPRQAAGTLPVVDRLVSEILRRYEGGRLVAHSLAQVAAEGLQEGWIDARGLKDLTLGQVRVNGSTAMAVLIVRGEPSMWSIPFSKTAQGWKLDPLAFYSIGELLLKAEIARQGFDEANAIDSIVNSLGPKKKK